jgi:hypothetical protein
VSEIAPGDVVTTANIQVDMLLKDAGGEVLRVYRRFTKDFWQLAYLPSVNNGEGSYWASGWSEKKIDAEGFTFVEWYDEMKHNPPPEPPPHCLVTNNGFLGLDGVLYPCCYGHHAELEYSLVTHLKLEKPKLYGLGGIEDLGFIKLQVGQWYADEAKNVPTEAQKDVIRQWCAQHKESVPYWLEWLDEDAGAPLKPKDNSVRVLSDYQWRNRTGD